MGIVQTLVTFICWAKHALGFKLGLHFLSHGLPVLKRMDHLICCLPINELKFTWHHSSYPPLLPAQIFQNWLSPTSWHVNCHNRTPAKGGCTLSVIPTQDQKITVINCFMCFSRSLLPIYLPISTSSSSCTKCLQWEHKILQLCSI